MFNPKLMFGVFAVVKLWICQKLLSSFSLFYLKMVQFVAMMHRYMSPHCCQFVMITFPLDWFCIEAHIDRGANAHRNTSTLGAHLIAFILQYFFIFSCLHSRWVNLRTNARLVVVKADRSRQVFNGILHTLVKNVTNESWYAVLRSNLIHIRFCFQLTS